MKFLRLDEQLDNLKLEPISLNEFNSFLCMSLNPMKDCKSMAIKQLYCLGRDAGRPIASNKAASKTTNITEKPELER